MGYTFTDNRAYKNYNLHQSNKNYPFVVEYLDRTIEVLNSALDQYKRCTVVRFDLRFPSYFGDVDVKEYRTAFIKNLKKKYSKKYGGSFKHIIAIEKSKDRKGTNTSSKHFHVVLFLDANKHYHNSLGLLPTHDRNGKGLWNVIYSSWQASIKDNAVGLVHICRSHRISREDTEATNDCFTHISYLCKKRTKFFAKKGEHIEYFTRSHC
ncbi:YagK/YfjJ domain-containing protein [Photobacterium lipolyticum]|uniref:YagK/YfjJ C-terminal domain-containing protein n=1 Tax=Photobacterium lipolyticum TaxID=266810 RepID=A0A2T3MSG3_9GAMM|nr:inovirus-type Gp2 protein [Photobacterium lipolyticum]PSW00295.1 hypothetical protein C9I89_21340 [Photobacterium lipolyticum]